MTWLRCDTDQNNPTVVDTLWCNACRMNEAKIIGMKNYSSAWINGSKQPGELTKLPEKSTDQGPQVQSHHHVALLLQRHPRILAWMTGMTFLIRTNHRHVYTYIHASCKYIQSYDILINYYDVTIINIIDVRPCPNKTSVGLTHCQINL